MTMQPDAFRELLIARDRAACLQWVQEARKTLSIPDLYEQVLAPALNDIPCTSLVEGICIWQEHERSAIVRTAVEMCAPDVLAQGAAVPQKNQTVCVICPDGETHELGARMAADFFTLNGYTTHFIGAGTPPEAVVDGLSDLSPEILAVSVTNYFNLVAANRTVSLLRQRLPGMPLILAGGFAFHQHPGAVAQIGADRLISSFEDIRKLAQEG